MKKLITMCALCLIAAGVYGQDTLKIQQQGNHEALLQKIDVHDLPEAIKEKLSGDDYSTWVVQQAYKTRGKTTETSQSADSAYYVIELKKEDETIRLWFDADGNKKDE